MKQADETGKLTFFQVKSLRAEHAQTKYMVCVHPTASHIAEFHPCHFLDGLRYSSQVCSRVKVFPHRQPAGAGDRKIPGS
jgi:hypothetical protein